MPVAQDPGPDPQPRTFESSGPGVLWRVHTPAVLGAEQPKPAGRAHRPDSRADRPSPRCRKAMFASLALARGSKKTTPGGVTPPAFGAADSPHRRPPRTPGPKEENFSISAPPNAICRGPLGLRSGRTRRNTPVILMSPMVWVCASHRAPSPLLETPALRRICAGRAYTPDTAPVRARGPFAPFIAKHTAPCVTPKPPPSPI